MTDKDKSEFRRLIDKSWSYIAEDCFVDDNGEPDIDKSFSRDDMLELTLDKIEMCLSTEEYLEYKRLRQMMPEYRSKEWEKLVQEVFTCDWYGY